MGSVFGTEDKYRLKKSIFIPVCISVNKNLLFRNYLKTNRVVTAVTTIFNDFKYFFE